MRKNNNTRKTHGSELTNLQNKQVFAVFLLSNVSFRMHLARFYFGDRVVCLVHTTNQTQNKCCLSQNSIGICENKPKLFAKVKKKIKKILQMK